MDQIIVVLLSRDMRINWLGTREEIESDIRNSITGYLRNISSRSDSRTKAMFTKLKWFIFRKTCKFSKKEEILISTLTLYIRMIILGEGQYAPSMGESTASGIGSFNEDMDYVCSKCGGITRCVTDHCFICGQPIISL